MVLKYKNIALRFSILVLICITIFAVVYRSSSYAGGKCHYNGENREHNYEHHVFETGSTRNERVEKTFILEQTGPDGRTRVYDGKFILYEKQVIHQCVCGEVDEKWETARRQELIFLYYK